tara:strand:- start:67 stop:2913 length:2847 start_codon:yes stop_codon:yes gene_type:complete
MANLKDVVESLKTIDTTLKKPVKKDSSDIEREQEAARDAKESKKIQQDILATLKAGVGGAVQSDKKQGGLIAGLLGGIGAGIGSIGKAVSKIGPSFIIGMGSIAAGIGAFMLALGGAGKIAELAGFDGKSLKALVENTIGAFSGTDLVVLAAVMGAAIGLEKTKTTKAGVILGMGSIGAGIGAFILALGGAGKIAELAGFDGKMLNTLVTNIFGAFSGTDLVVMASIIAAAVGLEKTKTTKAGVVLGMTAIGAGVGAFILALGGAGKIAELAGFDGKMLNTLIKNVFGAFSGTDLVVMASIIGAAIGLEKFKVSKVGVMLGMGAIGGGVAAFILGILAAEGFAKLGDLIALDGKNLATLMTNVFGAFGGVDSKALGALLIGGVAVGAVKGGVKAIMKGMGAIGGGVAAFTLGILAAEGFASLGALIGLDGKSLNTLLSNTFEAFSGISVAVLGGLLVAAGALGFAGPAGVKVAVLGMGAIGAGISAFSLGLLAAEGIAAIGKMIGLDGSALKGLLTNLGQGIGGFIGGIGKGMFEQLKDLDSDKLIDLGKGIAGIGAGIAAFGVGSILGVIGGVMEGLGSFFGVKSPIDTIIELSKDKDIDAARLKQLGEGLGPLGEGISAFAGFEMKGGFFGGDTDIESFIKVIAKIGDSKVKINADNLNNLAEGLGPFGKAMSGFSGVDIAKIVDESTFGKSTLEIFFDLLSSEKLGQMASPAEMQKVADGLTPLGKAMDTFSGLDMASIVGNNWTPGKETSFESFIGALSMATEKIKDPKHLQEVAIGIKALGEGMQSFKRIDATTINAALQSASGAELTKTAKRIAEQPDDDEIYAEGMTKAQLKAKYNIKGKVDRSKIRNAKKIAGMRGKALELKKAGLTEGTFVQGELANQKAMTLVNKSQENALAGTGGGQPVIINNNNVDNSVQSSQTTAVSMPEPTRTNESTVRALQNG